MKKEHQKLPQAKDWAKVRARMSSPQGDELLAGERARATLEERARLLAQIPPVALQAAEVIEVVIFALGRERYAFQTDHVREVLRVNEVTPLPGTPDFLLGIANVRGQILPLFDLRRFFGITDQERTDLSRMLVLGQEREEFGVLADAVFEVTRLRADEVLEAPGSVATVARKYVRGVTAEALILLDGAVLLQDPRFFIDQGEDASLSASGPRIAKRDTHEVER